jgi:hypothetical protein
MPKNNEALVETRRATVQVKGNPRKPYSKPQLEILGDLRNLTLGGSAGSGDSSNAGVQNPPKFGLRSMKKPKGLTFPGINPPEEPTPDNPFLP